MRTLLVTDWNKGRGGAEANIVAVRQGLLEAGDDVRLFTSSVGTAGDGLAEYVAPGWENMAAQAFLQIWNPFAASTLRRAIDEFRPEVAFVNMFAHHLSPAVLMGLRGVPTVLYVSDYKCVCPIGSKLLPENSLCEVQPGWVCHRSGCVGLAHWLRDRPRYALIHAAVTGVQRILACSQWVQKELGASGYSAGVLPSPVPAPGSAFLRKPSTHPDFLFCGRLDKEKGVELLLRAFASMHQQHANARLRILGQGPLRESLEQMTHDLGIGGAVDFLGWLSPAEVESHLVNAWASLIPSLWPEPQGMVAVEAMVRRIPVIASACGGLSEFVQHGVNGLLFPNNDQEALTRCMLAIASGEVFPEHQISSETARQAADLFSIERFVLRLRAVFSEIRGA